MVVPEPFEVRLRDLMATFQRAGEPNNTPDDLRSALIGNAHDVFEDLHLDA